MPRTNALASPKLLVAALAVALAAPALAEPQLHYWSGSTVQDAMGGPDAALASGATISQGAFHFNDGAAGLTQAYVDLGAAGDLGTSDFLVSFSFKTAQTDRILALLSKRPICDHSHFWSFRLQDGGVVVELDDGLQNYVAFLGRIRNLANGKWHTVVLARKGTTAALYVDGELDTTAEAPLGYPVDVANGATTVAGRDVCTYVDLTVPLVGALDEITISAK